MPRRFRAAWAVSLLMVLPPVGACQFESSDVCGPELEFNSGVNVCQCKAGSILVGGQCVACAEHEIAVVDKCECETGFVRGATGTCELPIVGLGDSCDPDQASSCAGKKYDYCARARAGDGYCTQSACSASTECPAGYTCAIWATPAFCERPPTGLGQTCAASTDCAGKDASFCEAFVSKACLVPNCDLGRNDCSDTFGCCDLSKFALPNLCVPIGMCPK
ncbi:MAG: hypothetical protein SFV15_00175 [Polyangiaceae bacterium]|nr:hypothetical protein [Polyangiaceae bacterium]